MIVKQNLAGYCRDYYGTTGVILKAYTGTMNSEDNITFFIVRCAKEGKYWISETPDDKHLRAYFGVINEPVSKSINRFYVITSVYYKHWTGGNGGRATRST